MSALGAVPGFAYPELDFSAVEFLSEFPRVVVPGGGGSLVATLADGGGGIAAYIDDVFVTIVTSALVGNRTAGLAVADGDGNFTSFYTNPLSVPASVQNNWIWAQRLTTVYSQFGTGYAPMQNVILLPGFTLALALQGLQAGDSVTGCSVTGRKIPYGVTPETPIARVAPVLLT